jgi:hypothetical protein
LKTSLKESGPCNGQYLYKEYAEHHTNIRSARSIRNSEGIGTEQNALAYSSALQLAATSNEALQILNGFE